MNEPMLARSHYGDMEATVLSVHDGDTFTILIPNVPPVFERMEVRIANIDTPEKHDSRADMRALAEQARVRLVELLRGKVVLREVRKDKFFRLNASVDVKGVDVADVLVKEGLAKRWDGNGAKPW